VGLFDAYEAVGRITTGVQSGTGTENVGASKHSISGGESIISQPKRDEGTDRAKSPKHEPVIKQKPKRHTNGKLAAQLKTDVNSALKANIVAMETAINRMNKTAARVTDYEKDLKTTLDKRIKAYKGSINQLFKLDSWREMLFFVGTATSILTPIVLIINNFF